VVTVVLRPGCSLAIIDPLAGARIWFGTARGPPCPGPPDHRHPAAHRRLGQVRLAEMSPGPGEDPPLPAETGNLASMPLAFEMFL